MHLVYILARANANIYKIVVFLFGGVKCLNKKMYII